MKREPIKDLEEIIGLPPEDKPWRLLMNQVAEHLHV